MLRPRLRIPQAGALLRRTTLFARSEHTVPLLEQFRQDNAVPGLLSPTGYSTAWTEYMQHIVNKLNILTAETDNAQLDPLTILKNTARDPSQAATFNYASMSHNNHFFFSQLVNLEKLHEQKAQAKTQAQEYGTQDIELEASENRIPPKLKRELERSFSSIKTLRLEFLTTALGMFGPGFVWLVKNANTQDLRILTTYLAGSPYTAAHWRRQSVDFNTSLAESGTVNDFLSRYQTGAGNSGGRFNPQAPGGTDVIPLLCVNTWEHVWLIDYGIGGKGEYVQAWWETIDWEKVESLAFNSQRDTFK
ncbi:Manganese/iron superoxide dismutase [Xylaria grammica]|nr:Manganese/iron superoxide dismutase [Xylaria grammica]